MLHKVIMRCFLEIKLPIEEGMKSEVFEKNSILSQLPLEGGMKSKLRHQITTRVAWHSCKSTNIFKRLAIRKPLDFNSIGY